jgi:hypothetical protein
MKGSKSKGGQVRSFHEDDVNRLAIQSPWMGENEALQLIDQADCNHLAPISNSSLQLNLAS